MKKNLPYLGMIGLIVFLFGLVTSFFTDPSQTSLISMLHIGCGLLLMTAFCLFGGLRPVGKAAVKRAAGFGAGVTLYSALFIGVLAVLNYGVSRHDPLHFDSTEQKVFTLAPQTKKILAALEREVVIRGFFVAGEVPPEIKGLMERLERGSDKLTWKVIDPEKEPALTERFGISERDTLHFSFADESDGRSTKIVRTIDEQEVVNALLKLTRGGEKAVYWLAGHDESNLDEAGPAGFLFLKEAIEGENLRVSKLELGATREIPEDAAALLVLAPRRDLLETETKTIQRYLERGGNALFLNEPNTTAQVRSLVRPLGIAVGDDVILDQVLRLFSEPGIGVQPMITRYGAHPVTEGFDQGIILSTASSVLRLDDAPAGARVTELAFTSENSWAESEVGKIFSEAPEASLGEEDKKGPVSIAAAFEGRIVFGKDAPAQLEAAPEPTEAGESSEESPAPTEEAAGAGEALGSDASDSATSRVVVIGDADFVANVNIRELFNRDFFLNALNWVVGEEEKISIRPRTLRESTQTLSATQFRSMFLITAILIPEVVVLGGFSVWWFRKR